MFTGNVLVNRGQKGQNHLVSVIRQTIHNNGSETQHKHDNKSTN